MQEFFTGTKGCRWLVMKKWSSENVPAGLSPMGRLVCFPSPCQQAGAGPEVSMISISAVVFHCQHLSPISCPAWTGHELFFPIFPPIISTQWRPELLCKLQYSLIFLNVPVLSGEKKKKVSLEADTPFISIWIFLNCNTFLVLNTLDYEKGSWVRLYRASSGLLLLFFFF